MSEEPVKFRKLASAWNNITAGKPTPKAPQASREPTPTTYKPGQDEAPSEEFSMRKAKQFLAEQHQQQKSKKVFRGSPEQCMLKIASLMGTLSETDPNQKFEKGQLLLVEEAGFGQYKITYIPA